MSSLNQLWIRHHRMRLMRGETCAARERYDKHLFFTGAAAAMALVSRAIRQRDSFDQVLSISDEIRTFAAAATANDADRDMARQINFK